MTKQEFETLTGIEVSLEEYAQYDDIYLQTDMDKQHFCADIKKHKNSSIIRELTYKCHRNDDIISSIRDDLQKKNEENDKLKDKLANMMIIHAYQTGSLVDRNEAIEFCGGVREYLIKKMNKGLKLSDEDMKDIKKIIENTNTNE